MTSNKARTAVAGEGKPLRLLCLRTVYPRIDDLERFFCFQHFIYPNYLPAALALRSARQYGHRFGWKSARAW
jgi:hypothetical protein